MHRESIIKFLNKHVIIGIPIHSRQAPFNFYAKLVEIGENSVLLELNDKSGFKSFKLSEIIEIRLDPRYNNKSGRHH